MDRITRKELKTDKFALEVGHGVEYVSEHKSQVIRYGAIVGGAVVIVLGVYGFLSYRSGVRDDALRAALQIQEAAVGAAGEEGRPSYPTAEAKEAAFRKGITGVAETYPGSEQGAVARYYLGIMAADKGDLPTAEKSLREVIDRGSKEYASLAKLSLASVLQAQGKIPDGERLLRSLVDHPTAFVSKDQATIVLARYLTSTNPAEARKLLEPLRGERSSISRAALSALSELPPSK